VVIFSFTVGFLLTKLLSSTMTEYYEVGRSLYIPARSRIYNPLLEAINSPFKIINHNDQPFEPLKNEPNTMAFFEYLEERYWN
jgi:hypothetical protein